MANNTPCCEQQRIEDDTLPKSSVSECCVPLLPDEHVTAHQIESVRGRCIALPSTNEHGHAECIPFITTTNACCPKSCNDDNAATSEDDNTKFELVRKLMAECFGTAALVYIVVGSGISGETYSADVGIALTINAAATFAGLYGLILILGPVSGAHFNPIVSLVDVMFGYMKPAILPLYATFQTIGAILGAMMANLTYDIALEFSEKPRKSMNLWLSEVLGTATLLIIIHGCLRTGNAANIPFAVAAWVGGGYFTFSSTIFANPAVTIGRMFTNTFAGIAPSSAWVYILFQLVGAVVGYGLIRFLYPKPNKTSN